jgi:hypothetical protein
MGFPSFRRAESAGVLCARFDLRWFELVLTAGILLDKILC